jgi:23S rRNA pseudouridine2457 synthase
VEKNYVYYTVYKPYGMLSQFTAEDGKKGLGELYNFHKSVYPVGRLDEDSEGLLILTNDKRLNTLLLSPKQSKTKTYWCLVEGTPDEAALKKLRSGVVISDKAGMHKAIATKATLMTEPPNIPERVPPVNYTKSPTHSWLEIQITEGKNRQVRKMTAAVGHPTLRLIRVAIENLKLISFEPGTVQQLFPKKIHAMLNIDME